MVNKTEVLFCKHAIKHNLKLHDVAILYVLSDNKRHTRLDIATQLGLSKDSIRWLLSELAKREYIKCDYEYYKGTQGSVMEYWLGSLGENYISQVRAIVGDGFHGKREEARNDVPKIKSKMPEQAALRNGAIAE